MARNCAGAVAAVAAAVLGVAGGPALAAAAEDPGPVELVPSSHLLADILAAQDSAARPPGIFVPGPAAVTSSELVPAGGAPAPPRARLPLVTSLEALSILLAGSFAAVAVYRWRQEAPDRAAYRAHHPAATRLQVALRPPRPG